LVAEQELLGGYSLGAQTALRMVVPGTRPTGALAAECRLDVTGRATSHDPIAACFTFTWLPR
jgi:hypothetical protein